MPALHDLQKAMLRAIAGGSEAEAVSHIVEGGIDPALRLDIYRSTFLSTLVKALRLSYPAVERLTGAEFFEGAARRFIENDPPRSAHLDDYGAGFADFLSGFAPAASLPYLADVARLEWAVTQALHAKDAAPLDLARLSALGEASLARLVFTPHPSVRFLCADFPADSIWRAVLSGDNAALAALDLADGPVWLMVCRVADEVEVARLTEAEWRFASQLSAGERLDSVLASLPADATALLARCLAQGMFIDISTDGGQFL